MKLKNLLNLMVLGSALTITAVGCKTHPLLTPIPKNHYSVGEPGPDIPPGPQLPPSNPGDTSNTGIPLKSNLEGWSPVPGDPLHAETVHFDFDKSSIKASEEPKIEDVAKYLKDHPDQGVRIEGNCDERGTEEYNRALGERRALAAREYLVRLGIDPNKVATISYGQDKPASQGHNEAAWSQNRRDDFVALQAPRP